MLRKTRQFEPNNAARGADGARRAAKRDKTYERLGRVLPSASSSALSRGIPVICLSGPHYVIGTGHRDVHRHYHCAGEIFCFLSKPFHDEHRHCGRSIERLNLR